MADDTRKPTTPSTASPDEAPSVASVAREARPPANIMPGGTAHTAGGERVDDKGPTYIDAVRSLPAEYYLTFYKRPCVRDSQLTGIGAGFVGGSIAAVMRSMSIRSTRLCKCCRG
jgi:cytochrome c oxidase assembly protein subunit 20